MPHTLRKNLQEGLNLSSEGAFVHYIVNPFTVANWLFVFPAAFALGRYAVRHVTLGALGLTVIGTLGTAFSESPWLTAFFRFLIGTAHAFCFLCCMALVNSWFSADRRGFVMGVVVMIGVSGATMAQWPLGELARNVGWRNALYSCGGFSALVWVFAFFFLEDYSAKVEPMTERVATHSWSKIQLAFSNRRTWSFSLYVVLLNAFYAAIALTYLNVLLEGVHRVDKACAERLSLLFFVGITLGFSVSGWVSERWKSRRKPMLVGSFFSFCLIGLLMLLPSLPFWVLGMLLFALGLFNSVQVLAYPAVAACNPTYNIAASMSVVSCIVMGGFAFSPNITAWIGDYLKGDVLSYVVTQAHACWILFPVFLAAVASFVVAFFSAETFGKQAGDKEKGG